MSAFDEPAVITCALTGAGSREGMSQIPATPKEFADEARRVADAGASVVHIHGRDPDTGAPSHDVGHIQAIVQAIRESAPELIINITTGGGIHLSPEERMAPALAVRADFGTISMGSLNLAAVSSDRSTFDYDLVFGNSFSTITHFLKEMNRASMQIDYEFYEAGHIANYNLLQEQKLTGPGVFSLILGVTGAMAATTQSLVHMVQLLPAHAHWEVVTPGLKQWPMAAAAFGLGGTARVGFEDNAYLSAGIVARSNGDLVDKVVRMANDIGRTIATPSQAREILGVR